jgi:hypothetical protein
MFHEIFGMLVRVRHRSSDGLDLPLIGVEVLDERVMYDPRARAVCGFSQPSEALLDT